MLSHKLHHLFPAIDTFGGAVPRSCKGARCILQLPRSRANSILDVSLLEYQRKMHLPLPDYRQLAPCMAPR